MIQRISKNEIRGRIHTRIRHRVRGTAERPRLAVYRSLGHIYAQLIDDMQGRTLVAAASSEKALRAAAAEAAKGAAAKGAAAKSPAAEPAKPETAKADAEKSAKGETGKADTVKRASVKGDAGIAPKTGASEKTAKGGEKGAKGEAEKGAKGDAEKSAKPDSEKSGAKGKGAKPENTKVSGGNLSGAQLIGKTIADRAKQKGIKKVVFDRGGYLYHGRIKALADAAREAGLEF